MEQELAQLGLTPNEIKIYNTILVLGENTVGPLINKLNMHRQVAYDALKGLEEKNMIVVTTKNNRSYFRIADPQNILNNIKHQEIVAKNLVKEINNKLKGQKRGQEIRVHEGEDAYRNLVMQKEDLQPNNSEYKVVGTLCAEFKEMMSKSGTFERSNRIRKEKNITTKLILNEKLRQEAKKMSRVNSEIRFLSPEHTTPTALDIWHDSVVLTSFIGDMFCIEIKNEAFRQSYLSYFDILWKVAKK